MRRRKNKQGALVFLLALLGSAVLHGVLSVPVGAWLAEYLFSPSDKPAPPVRLVQLSQEQWSKNRRVSRRNAKLRPPPPRPKAKAVQKRRPKQDPNKLRGQIVEVPPTADDSPNPDAKYLSKYNSNTKKESVARYEERDRTKKRVTSRLQQKQRPKPRPKTAKNPVLDVKGDGLEGEQAGKGKGGKADKGEFVLELPSLKRREGVRLRLRDMPGVRQSNQTGQEELNGNGKKFRLEMGGAGPGDDGSGKKGKEDGLDKPSLPSLESLRPTIGTIARISGSPSNDYIENVPEGDGTFLNTKEFKYATFFYRVKDSVGSLWYDMVTRELRRRDPTGNIYGPRDRSTLLTIRIGMDGHLAEVTVASSSGVQFLDDVAVQAFKRAEPFPNPPSAMADENGYIKFNFQFVMLRSRGPLNLFNFR